MAHTKVFTAPHRGVCGTHSARRTSAAHIKSPTAASSAPPGSRPAAPNLPGHREEQNPCPRTHDRTKYSETPDHQKKSRRFFLPHRCAILALPPQRNFIETRPIGIGFPGHTTERCPVKDNRRRGRVLAFDATKTYTPCYQRSGIPPLMPETQIVPLGNPSSNGAGRGGPVCLRRCVRSHRRSLGRAVCFHASLS